MRPTGMASPISCNISNAERCIGALPTSDSDPAAVGAALMEI